MGETDYDIVAMFNRSGARRDGHFTLASGRCGLVFLDAWYLYTIPEHRDRLFRRLANKLFLYEGEPPIDVLIGPERGAIWLVEGVTGVIWRETGRTILSMFAEKDKSRPGEKYAFKIPERWAGRLPGKRVGIIEDVSTTGGSPAAVARLVEECGGIPVLTITIWNRGNVTAEDIGVPKLVSLVNQEFPSYEPDECPRHVEESK